MQTEQHNEHTICFRYIIFVMKMFAVYPFFPLHEVMDTNRIFSMILTVISISIFAWVNFTEQMNTLFWIFYYAQNYNFIALLGGTVTALSKSLYLVIPFSTWSKNNQLRNYSNNWKRFQIEIEKLTRSSFHCSARYKIQGIFTIGMLNICVFCLLLRTRKFNTFRSPRSFFAVVYILNGSANVMTYWITNNIFTISAMKKIINFVQKSIDEDKKEDLRRLIDVWIMVCDLIDEFINIHANLFLILFCIIIAVGTINSFIMVLAFVYLPDKSIGLTYGYINTIQIIYFMTFCESANSVTEYVVHKLRRILLAENVNKKNEKLLQVIVSFLQTIEAKNPQINFNGYMTVNRSLFYEVIGAAINFLVVLKQFSPI